VTRLFSAKQPQLITSGDASMAEVEALELSEAVLELAANYRRPQ
jgi:hypothetical protein